jgi:hypothetical protein
MSKQTGKLAETSKPEEARSSAAEPLNEGTAPARAPIAGLPLPPGFVNPPAGEHGHLCLDPEGRYRPTWSCVFIHKTAEVPERQPFLDENCNSIMVATDRWADVPPPVVWRLQDTRVSKIVRDGMSGAALTRAMSETEVGSTPRWQYSMIPSG